MRRRGAGGPPAASVTTTPTRVGANLWMTVLTAGAPGGGTFETGRVYEYELNAPWAASRPIPWGDLSLPGATRPTFLAPPANAADLDRLPHVLPEAARRRA